MDFDFSDDEQAVAQLARQILGDHTTNEALKAHERGGEPYDLTLWRDLAKADLLGLAIPEADGGSGLSFLVLCLFLEEVGRAVAPVPAYATLVLGALPIARFGDATTKAWLPEVARGERVLTGALVEPTTSDLLAPATRVVNDAVHGTKSAVPYAEQSSHLVVSTTDGLVVIDARGAGVRLHAQQAVDGAPHALVELDGAPVVARLGDRDAVRWLVEHAAAASCAVALGVAERALEMTGAYSRERVQFDRPIGSFQAVHQRAADAFIWVESMRLTAWEAAWRLSAELPAAEAVAVAKYVATEGGQYTAYACQHLHGGIGIDVDYPLHRYFKWATQLEHELGSARHHLDRLGDLLASSAGRVGLKPMTEAALQQQLDALVGRPISGTGSVAAPDPVNQPMIRHWAATFEDWNPVYTDPDAASQSRFGGIVAPPLMLQTWTMATPKITGIAERGGSPVEGNRATVLNLLDEAGFTGTLASNSEFEIVRYLRVGDEVTSSTVLESVGPEKQTRLGAAHFVTWLTTYRVGDEVVGRQLFRILKFRPGGTP